jgi:hypothetical protein
MVVQLLGLKMVVQSGLSFLHLEHVKQNLEVLQ